QPAPRLRERKGAIAGRRGRRNCGGRSSFLPLGAATAIASPSASASPTAASVFLRLRYRDRCLRRRLTPRMIGLWRRGLGRRERGYFELTVLELHHANQAPIA